MNSKDQVIKALKIDFHWQVGFCNGADARPEKMVEAKVPGAVQLDWARAQGWGDYFYADNWKDNFCM